MSSFSWSEIRFLSSELYKTNLILRIFLFCLLFLKWPHSMFISASSKHIKGLNSKCRRIFFKTFALKEGTMRKLGSHVCFWQPLVNIVQYVCDIRQLKWTVLLMAKHITVAKHICFIFVCSLAIAKKDSQWRRGCLLLNSNVFNAFTKYPITTQLRRKIKRGEGGRDCLTVPCKTQIYSLLISKWMAK